MSEYRKISTLCPSQPNVSSRSFADIKAEMSGWIRMNIDRVLPDSPDLIVLPECSSRYNCPAGVKYDDYKQQLKDYYRYVGDEFTQMLSRIAAENNTIIAYSAIRVADDSDKPFRNSTVYIGRSGEVIGIYDKNYLVIEENTLSDIAYGERAELIDLGFAKAATAICFDLNFDELLEDYAAMRPKLVVFSSMYHGGIRQAIWAYQCRSYLVSSTKGLPGAILDPFGRTIAAATNYLPYVTARVNFDFALCHLDHNWEPIRRREAQVRQRAQGRRPGVYRICPAVERAGGAVRRRDYRRVRNRAAGRLLRPLGFGADKLACPWAGGRWYKSLN